MLKTATVVTLGCAKNSVDSEHIKGSLLDAGFRLVDDPSEADYIIVNTCGFIEAAKQESIDTILELSDLKDDSNPRNPKLIVTGCLAQRYFDELAEEMPEIDMLTGIDDEKNIARIIADGEARSISPNAPSRDFTKMPQRVLEGLPYAYLQIADGCDTRCSYCAIPIIRGPYRSKPIEQVIEEARWLDSQGIKEINIVAQDTGRYGYDLYGKRRLGDLLSALTDFENVEWIRLLYLQPFNIDDDLINAFRQNPHLLPYIDMPLQHASSGILRMMNRTGAGEDYLALIAWIRRAIPEIVIRSTVIVGFPGETDDDFRELTEFVKRAEFDYMGVFEYSEEEGTKAASLDNRVPVEIARDRYHELSDLQDMISRRRNDLRIDSTFKVLIESKAEAGERLYEARAWWQAPEVDGATYVAGDAENKQIVNALIEDFDGCDFHGRITGGPSQ